mmetsp:Transcript_44181/g.116801  ORF Transcript_44181/g.116801 Transcript_44181/m.116801 type:complete len:232 (-) Transcript_44181:452-1147(-)
MGECVHPQHGYHGRCRQRLQRGVRSSGSRQQSEQGGNRHFKEAPMTELPQGVAPGRSLQIVHKIPRIESGDILQIFQSWALEVVAKTPVLLRLRRMQAAVQPRPRDVGGHEVRRRLPPRRAHLRGPGPSPPRKMSVRESKAGGPRRQIPNIRGEIEVIRVDPLRQGPGVRPGSGNHLLDLEIQGRPLGFHCQHVVRELLRLPRRRPPPPPGGRAAGHGPRGLGRGLVRVRV